MIVRHRRGDAELRAGLGGRQPGVNAVASEFAPVVLAGHQGLAARVAVLASGGAEQAFAVADPTPFDEAGEQRSELMPADPDREPPSPLKPTPAIELRSATQRI